MMKIRQLQLMVITALFIGVQAGGMSVVNGASAHTSVKTGAAAKPAVTKTATPKAAVQKTSVQKGVPLTAKMTTKAGGSGKSSFRPLVTKQPQIPAKSAAKANAGTTGTKSAAKTASAAASKGNTAVKAATAAKAAAKAAPVAADKSAETGNAVKTASAVDKKTNMPDVRVLLGSRRQAATVASSAGLSVVNSTNNKVSSVGANTKATVGIKGDKISVNGKAVDTMVTLKPADNNAPFLFEGKGYRGGLTLRAANGSMMVINSVPLEDYLYGVVPQEVVPSWPAAALEAQAVAARTYALHVMEQNKGKSYDVSPSTDHQVYGGVGGESQATTAAVNKTRGVVMLYNQRPINALFHADGGGYTEDSVNVWGNDIPYLKGVKDFSKGTESSNWTVTTSRQALESKLNAASKGVGRLKSIQLTPLGKPGKETADRGVSGRIKSATFIGSSGKVTVSGDDLRNILGLKSTLFDFYVNHNPSRAGGKSYHNFSGKNDAVYIKGQGWGHGLGLSQWGAAEMAKQAKPGDTHYYQTILKHYYSGITLKKMY